jgi:hypothetical protein
MRDKRSEVKRSTLVHRAPGLGKIIGSNAKTPRRGFRSVFADQLVGGKVRLAAASPWTRTWERQATTPDGS